MCDATNALNQVGVSPRTPGACNVNGLVRSCTRDASKFQRAIVNRLEKAPPPPLSEIFSFLQLILRSRKNKNVSVWLFVFKISGGGLKFWTKKKNIKTCLTFSSNNLFPISYSSIHGRLIVVAVTLGLDNEYGNNGGVNGTIVLTNETAFLSLSNETHDIHWSSEMISGDGDDEQVAVVAELHALQKENDACENVLRLLLIIKTALLGVSLLLEISMAWLALRGTMWDVHPRRFMEYVLYSRLRTKLLFFF